MMYSTKSWFCHQSIINFIKVDEREWDWWGKGVDLYNDGENYDKSNILEENTAAITSDKIVVLTMGRYLIRRPYYGCLSRDCTHPKSPPLGFFTWWSTLVARDGRVGSGLITPSQQLGRWLFIVLVATFCRSGIVANGEVLELLDK